MELHPMLETDTVPNADLWFVVSGLGDCPTMRVGHSCVFVKSEEGRYGKVYVIGGANPSGPFSDTHVLDLQTLSWDFFQCPGLRPRYEHAAFVPKSQPSKIYVFGGADQAGNMNDIQVLDTAANTWSAVTVSGAPPSARTHHTSAAIGDKLYIYSGGQCGADPVMDRKVHCFDATTQAWSVVPVKGDSPKPRHGHAMATMGNKLFLHGGMSGSTFYDDFHVLDLDKNLWSNLRRKGVHPSPRAAHSLVVSGRDILLFGGMNQAGSLDDMYSFSTESSTWSRVELQGPPPASRLDFGLCTVELPRLVSEEASRSADLVVAGTHAKDILDRELSKPGSASSQGSQSGSDSSFGAFVVNERLLPDTNNSSSETVDKQEVEGATCESETKAATSPLPDESYTTYTLCMINGGMDTEGQIFNDTLVFLLK